jgi:DNA invertase Pin-like site-specific DNA recombinase
MAALAHGDVVIIPAVDRLSRDTTDLLVIARLVIARLVIARLGNVGSSRVELY